MSQNPPYRLSMHDRLCFAMHECETRQTGQERMDTLRELFSMGWRGGPVFPAGYMASVLEKVSPLKFDEALRRSGLRGYGEDTQ